jgi:hypothetical protein
VAATLVGIGALAGGRWLLERRAVRGLSAAFADYERCFLGAPLADGEPPSQRAFRIYLALTAPGSPGSGGSSPWPASCVTAGREVKQRLRSWFLEPEVWSRLHGPVQWADVDPADWDAAALEIMDRQWALLPRDRLWPRDEVTESDSAIEAPAPSAPPLLLPRLGPGLTPRKIERDGVVTDPVAGEALHLLLSEGEPDTICILDLALALAKCRPLPAPLVESLHPSLAMMSEGAPLLVRSEMVGRRRRPGLFLVGPRSARLVEPTLFDAPPAFIDEDGELVILRRVSEPVELEEHLVRTGRGGTALSDVRLDLPTSHDLELGERIEVDLVRRHVLWAKTRGGETDLFVQTIPKRPHPPIASRRIGPVPTGGKVIAACHDEQTTSIVWASGARAVLIRETRGAWAPPLPVSLGASPRLTCEGGDVGLTSVAEAEAEGTYRVRFTRCDTSCETVSSEPLALDIEALEDAIAAPAGDRFTLLWRRGKSTSRSLEGVAFARTATLESLHESTDRPLRTSEDALVTPVDAIDLFARRSGVAITLTTTKGAFAACVPRGGNLIPVQHRVE